MVNLLYQLHFWTLKPLSPGIGETCERFIYSLGQDVLSTRLSAKLQTSPFIYILPGVCGDAVLVLTFRGCMHVHTTTLHHTCSPGINVCLKSVPPQAVMWVFIPTMRRTQLRISPATRRPSGRSGPMVGRAVLVCSSFSVVLNLVHSVKVYTCTCCCSSTISSYSPGHSQLVNFCMQHWK